MLKNMREPLNMELHADRILASWSPLRSAGEFWYEVRRYPFYTLQHFNFWIFGGERPTCGKDLTEEGDP